jgi:Xaa-Pro aminopeptidase
MVIDARDVIAPMRMVKDAHEISLMKKAAHISALGHIRAMQTPCIGRHEYEIEAELTQTFVSHGARAHAYPPIVASGRNACVLHYTDNHRVMKRGELLLIDAGCEYRHYAGDITRTFPTGKRFTGAQRDVYQIVLAAQSAALDALTVGAPFYAYHEAAARVLTQGLMDLKLIKGSLNAALETKKYRRFYMHGAGHWLGLDVHDAGFYKNNNEEVKLMAGMVVTVEPGLYIREADDVPSAFHHIGVRIEDDVLMTETGKVVLTEEVPKTVKEVEALRP